MAGKTILIVEDNVIQREGLAFVLREEGYAVLTAADADEGLSWLRSEPAPDLVLLDMLVSKGHDGWFFLGQRQQIPAAAVVPVIITTGVGNASDEWAVALGACGLLRKPLEVAPLLAQVRRCLGA
jgi:CheY-like chemotaxis protein